MGTIIEKSLKERWQSNVIDPKLIIELEWRRKNGTLPKAETWKERLIELIKNLNA